MRKLVLVLAFLAAGSPAFAAAPQKFVPIVINEAQMTQILNSIDQIAMPQTAYRAVVGIFRDLEQRAQATQAAEGAAASGKK